MLISSIQNGLMYMNIGRSISKAKILSFDSKKYCERTGENLTNVRSENLLKLNVNSIKASAIMYLLYNGLMS